jgi:hypothetical protein
MELFRICQLPSEIWLKSKTTTIQHVGRDILSEEPVDLEGYGGAMTKIPKFGNT